MSVIVSADDVQSLYDTSALNGNEISKEMLVEEGKRMHYLRPNHNELEECDQRARFSEFMEGINNQAGHMNGLFGDKPLRLKSKSRKVAVYYWVPLKELFLHKLRVVDHKQTQERFKIVFMLEKFRPQLAKSEKGELDGFKLKHGIQYKLEEDN